MAYHYDVEKMKEGLQKLISKNLDTKTGDWLHQQYNRYIDTGLHRQGIALSPDYANTRKPANFNLTFTAIPRFINKTIIEISDAEKNELHQILPEFEVSGWQTERLVRSWWLLQLPVEDEAAYVKQVTGLFKAAEMNEQVALYGSLPLLAYPEKWKMQASEGLRTNMSVVFDAIALHNPYPSGYMEEAAWNQLVLKSFFMDRPVNQIIGLDERANKELAHILSDYAHERWAAGRNVDPLLWRPVAPFIDEKIFPDIERLFQSEDEKERRAAALACLNSSYESAKELLKQFPALKMEIEARKITWEDF